MKKLICNCLLLLIFSLSCSNQDVNNNEDENFENISDVIHFKKDNSYEISYQNNQFVINFKSSLLNEICSSTLEVLNAVTQETIINNNFIFDRNVPSYELGIYKKVENTSNGIKNNLDKETWTLIRNSYEDLIKGLINDLDYDTYYSDLVQSNFYHLSIFNTIVRSYNSSNCECTPITSYFVGISSFWCQEDYSFDSSKLLEYFDNNKAQLFSFEFGEDIYNYVKDNSNQNPIISFRELFEIRYSLVEYKQAIDDLYSNPENKKDTDDCWSGLLGTDLGCCGNYSGCC